MSPLCSESPTVFLYFSKSKLKFRLLHTRLSRITRPSTTTATLPSSTAATWVYWSCCRHAEHAPTSRLQEFLQLSLHSKCQASSYPRCLLWSPCPSDPYLPHSLCPGPAFSFSVTCIIMWYILYSSVYYLSFYTEMSASWGPWLCFIYCWNPNLW